MRKRKILPILTVSLVAVILLVGIVFRGSGKEKEKIATLFPPEVKTEEEFSPLAIETLRKRSYPGSEITIEETLAPGVSYNRYIASYQSEGFKIFGLFTVPTTAKPDSGFPAIAFIHGYLAPEEYITTERYVAYQDGFARNGYVTFKPDLRGHGKSEGNSAVSNFSPDYVIDALNVVSSLKKYKEVNPQKIGMWGHSMGGGITLRSMVVSKEIKAGVIWAGVVGNYEDLLERYRRRIPWLTSQTRPPTFSVMRDFLEKNGSPSSNPKFWQTIEPYSFLKNISGPVQLHHGTADDSVPIEFSKHLEESLKKEGKTVEYYEYEGGDHNLGGFTFGPAMERSIAFFDRYIKDEQ